MLFCLKNINFLSLYYYMEFGNIICPFADRILQAWNKLAFELFLFTLIMCIHYLIPRLDSLNPFSPTLSLVTTSFYKKVTHQLLLCYNLMSCTGIHEHNPMCCTPQLRFRNEGRIMFKTYRRIIQTQDMIHI